MKNCKFLFFIFLTLFTSISIFPQSSAEANSFTVNNMTFSKKALENTLTKKYLKEYTSNFSKKNLTQMMKASNVYRSYTVSVLKKYDMPLCLQYLPVIESGYKINATSKSGAKGLWQFMPNSVSSFGIRIDEELDERLDPWLSTDAAIKKLRDNYMELGSWEMALAAYNSGLGAMKRAIKEGNTNDYWELCEKGLIREESKNYVPKFIAISIILENKKYFGLNFPDVKLNSKVNNFETIKVNKAISLKVLSEKTGIPLKALEYYNPALLKGITPENREYLLRLPENTSVIAEIIIFGSTESLR